MTTRSKSRSPQDKNPAPTPPEDLEQWRHLVWYVVNRIRPRLPVCVSEEDLYSAGMVGLMTAIARATGRDKDLHTKGMISEVMMMCETVRALLFSAEEQSHEDQWGNFVPLRRPIDTSRNLFPKMYPRMVEILQLLGSSSLMATPSEADFSNAMTPDVEKYFQVANLEARDRVALFRLAHDVCVSGFGNRQALYERFFFGPPAIMAAGYFDLYDADPMVERVEKLLG